jgi:hypothetical protein
MAASREGFRDAGSASAWLAAQPPADTPAMLSGLTARIEAFNLLDLSPRKRLKTLEVLRNAVFAAGAACRRQCEGQPLPLDADEQAALTMARRLWRGYAAGYQQCLQACLNGDASLSGHAARVAHRVSVCLRVEQLTGYAGGFAPGLGFWKNFHALFLAAEQLGCLMETQEDRLFGEMRASSVFGQYVMALMLHLARPFSLSSEQLATAVRWLARWCEQARIDEQAEADGRRGPILLDLAADRPVHEGEGEARQARWLSLGNVQRKIRQRLDALAAGESPESLKLGDKLSAANCVTLLNTLADNLRHPPQALPAVTETMPSLSVGVGLAFIHCLLGGKGFEDAVPATPVEENDPITRNRLAVYGHIAPEAPRVEIMPERWRLVYWKNDELALLRMPGEGRSRLALRGLLAIGQQEDYMLAVINGLWQSEDGALYCSVNLLPGKVTPRVAEIRNWMSGEVVRHPAFQLSVAGDQVQDMMLLPTGALVRASGVRFFDGDGELQFGLRVSDRLERGNEIEFWRVPSND